jgi:hypothetical protein
VDSWRAFLFINLDRTASKPGAGYPENTGYGVLAGENLIRETIMQGIQSEDNRVYLLVESDLGTRPGRQAAFIPRNKRTKTEIERFSELIDSRERCFMTV